MKTFNFINFQLLITVACFLLSTFNCAAQNYCGSSRYDTEIFTNVTVISDKTYGSNLDLNGNTVILKMDIYQPAGDTATQRPLIIFAHGGSFTGGDKADTFNTNFSTRFAKRGYVVASINYRLGVALPISQANMQKAIWRAVQDMKAAVRFFRKDNATANNFKIDPAFVFTAGISAGSFIALNYAYLDQSSEIPSAIDTNQLGGLEGNSGNLGYSSAINAIINLSGGISDTLWMRPGDEPMVSAHGDQDSTIPYCTDTIFAGTTPIMVVSGSGSMNIRAGNIGLTNPMHTFYGQGHCATTGGYICPDANVDTTIFLISDFLYSQIGCTPAGAVTYVNEPTTCDFVTDIGNFNDPDFNFRVYPNPSTGKFWVQTVNNSNLLSLYNAFGEKITSSNSPQKERMFDLSSYPNGLYFLILQTENQVFVKKIIKN